MLEFWKSIQEPRDICILEYFPITVTQLLCKLVFIVAVSFEANVLVLMLTIGEVAICSTFIGRFGSRLQVLIVVFHLGVPLRITYVR
jgi:hypothetical protein